MATAVIVDAVRTAGGKRNGQLSGWHPAELAGEVLRALVDRSGLDPAHIDDVIMGCVLQVGLQGINIGRTASLAAGFPEHVPAVTIDRQCGSSQQAVSFAAQAVMSGVQDVVVAAGVEVMSTTPLGSTRLEGVDPYGRRVRERFAPSGGLTTQGEAAELIARKWSISRRELDEYAASSHARADASTRAGRFRGEIVAVPVKRATAPDAGTGAGSATDDEGIRPATTVEGLAALRPAFAEDGVITAGNSSQICDGASAALIMSEGAAARFGLVPRARIHRLDVIGGDPTEMLTAPIPATRRVLAKAGVPLDAVDRIEMNEAFASVVLAWQRELGADLSKVNVNGGAIALGHPLGASGTKLLATLLGELERSGGRLGLQVMCEGGGQANALLVERV